MFAIVRPGLACLLALTTTACIFHVDAGGIDPENWNGIVQGSPKTVRELNRAKLLDLEVGMSLEQAQEVMGTDSVWAGKEIGWINNPYRSESFPARDGGSILVLFYYSHVNKRDNIVNDDELTPVAFRDGALAGWGWTYLERTVGAL